MARDYTQEQLEQIDRWGRQVAIEIHRRNPRAAYHLIDDAIAELEVDAGSPVLADIPLAECGIDLRTLNMLEKHFAAVTVGDVLTVEVGAILSVRMVNTQVVLSMFQQLMRFVLKRDESQQSELHRLRGLQPTDQAHGAIKRKRHRQATAAMGGET